MKYRRGRGRCASLHRGQALLGIAFGLEQSALALVTGFWAWLWVPRGF